MSADESTSLRARLDAVRAQIAAAATRAGRDPADVQLLAVSKLHSVDAIRQVYAAGQRDFGENYAQELAKKADALQDLGDLRWHFIGHLQRNKARDVLGVRACVHTVDSERLGRELATRAAALGIVAEVFVQANLAGEAQKSGCAPEDLGALVDLLRALPSLRLRGLTVIPPLSDEPEDSRPYFRELRQRAHALGLADLSMGMSADLEVAIEEGSTLVRVGTAIFGERPAR